MVRHLFQVMTPALVGALVATLLSPRVGAEQARPAGRSGYIEIISTTMGAEVEIDGEAVGVVPVPEKIQVPVGEHSVKVSKRGFTQLVQVVAVKLHKTVAVEADLLALTGVLKVSSNVEKARVFVDNEYIGDAPIEQEVDPGARNIKVRLLGYYDFQKSVEVVAGEEIELAAELQRLPPDQDPTIAEPPRPRHWYERWWVWTIIGTVFASTVVAIGVAVPLALRQDHCAQYWGVDDCNDGVISVHWDLSSSPP